VKKILTLIGFLMVSPVFAQGTVAPTVPPVLDATDKLIIGGLERAAALADSRCKSLEEYKVYVDVQKGADAHLNVKYPRFTYNWNTRTFTPKVVK